MMDKADYSRFDRQRCFGRKIVRPVPSFISPDIVGRSLSHYDINPLYYYLSNVFGVEGTMRLFDMYRIGTSAKWGGATIFWQTDISGNVRTGKIMLYDTQTGYRIKEPQAYISWAHFGLHLTDFNLQQCLFGEHLLKTSVSEPIMLVESEKTAVIMAYFIPDYLWLATNHYDKTRMKLNFEIGPDGKIHPLGYQVKSLEVRLQERLAALGWKPFKLDSKIQPNCCAKFVFGGNHDRTLEMAFGNQSINLEKGADNSHLRRCEKIENWAKDVYDWCVRRYGQENIAGF